MTSLDVSGSSAELHGGSSSSAGAWRSIAWKEWRESAKWGTAGLLLVSGALAVNLYNESDSTGGYAGLQDDGLLGLYTVACCTVALCMGVMSWAFDVTPDRWALLIHRPATRAQWWWGKVGVSLAVYATAVLLPWFVAGWWCSVPGNVAGPWYPEMLLPGAVNASGGGLFYFAGMLTVLRSARWWVSRAVWVLTAGVFATLVYAMPSLLWTLVSLTLGWLLLAHASWSHFRAKADRPLSVAGQISSSLSVFVGIVVAGGVLAGVVGTFLSAGNEEDPKYEAYGVMADGTVVVTTRGRRSGLIDVHDLQGVLVPPPLHDTDGWSVENEILAFADLLTFHFPQTQEDGYRANWRQLPDRYTPVQPMAWNYGVDYPKNLMLGGWYIDQKEGLFQEYGPTTRRLVGWMGPDGYVTVKSNKPTGFTGPIRRSGHQELEVYRTVHEVFAFRTDTREKLVIDQAKVPTGYDAPIAAAYTRTTTPQFDLLIDGRMIRRAFDGIFPEAKATNVFDQSYREDPQQWPIALVYHLSGDAGWVGIYSQPWDWRTRTSDAGREKLVVRVSSSGEELERLTVPELQVWSSGGDPGLFTKVALLGGVPLAAYGWSFIVNGQTIGWAYATSDSQTLGFGLITLLLLFAVVGLSFGVLCVVQARRAGLPGRQVVWWAVMGFFGGLAGWLTMRCSYRWRELKVTRGAFSAPAPSGTEIWVSTESEA